MDPSPPGSGRRPNSPWAYAGMGLELALPVVIFLWLGYRVDSWLGNQNPWFMLAGALLGGVVGLYVFVRRLLPRDGGEKKG